MNDNGIIIEVENTSLLFIEAERSNRLPKKRSYFKLERLPTTFIINGDNKLTKISPAVLSYSIKILTYFRSSSQ